MSQDRDDQDRTVSRRVDHPVEASPGDEAAYRAADPLPEDGRDAGNDHDHRDSGSGPDGASATDAAAETARESSEPTRSE